MFPRFSRHEVLGNEPRFGSRSGLQVRVGQLRLRDVHRRFERPVHADFNDPQECRNVARHTGNEVLKQRGCRGPIRLRGGAVGGDLDDAESAFRRLLRDLAAKQRDVLAARRIVLEQLSKQRHALVYSGGAELDLGGGEQQLWIGAGRLGCQELSGGREVAAVEKDPRQLNAKRFVVRVEPSRIAERLDALLDVTLGVQGGGERLQLLGRACTFTRPGELAGGDKHLDELLLNVPVFGTEQRRLTQRPGGRRMPPLVPELGGNGFQIVDGGTEIADLDARDGARNTRVDVGRVERAKANRYLGDAPFVAPRAPPLGDCIQVRARLDQQPLERSDVRRPHERMLVIRLQLEDFLVDRRRLRQESVGAYIIGDADELLDRLVHLTEARVQVADQIRSVPVPRLFGDDAQVLRNGSLELALADQLLRIAQCGGAIDGHESAIRSASLVTKLRLKPPSESSGGRRANLRY